MRQGNYAKLVFSNSGNLIAISTGSDATAEHECGSEDLQRALSGAFDSDQALIGRLKAGEPVQYPALLARKTLTKNLDTVQFIEVPGQGEEPPQAILGYAGSTNLMYFKNELRFPSAGSTFADENVAGAWDQESFAVRVRGVKYCKALKAFYQGLMAGKLAFAGTFYKPPKAERLSGVILADLRYIDDDSRKAMAAAQTEYESKLRLKAKDDVAQLWQDLKKASGLSNTISVGHLWAMWKDERESEVVYGFNPGYDVSKRADYYGPYSRQQLLDWAAGGFKGELRAKRAQTASA